jgi:acetoin utilization deacetylase AcuC-like enzyme
MLVVHHPDQVLHDPPLVFRYGKFIGQPDRAERYEILLRAATAAGHRIAIAPESGLDAILAIHDPAYVTFLQSAWERWQALPDASEDAIPSVHPTHRMTRMPKHVLGQLGWYSNSTSCPIQAQTWQAVLASAWSVVAAADRVCRTGEAAYALCRPPGHHAYPDLMTGVCYLNNASIGAQRLAAHYGKVAIIDIDVHHGNGTQHIFWERPDVFFCSIHGDPTHTAPFYAGYEDETGGGAGRGLNLNIPLPLGTGDLPFLDAVNKGLAAIKAFGPAVIVVSLGFDGSEHDPHKTFAITDTGFQQTAQRIAALGLPTLLVQEGGYINPQRRAALGVTLTGFLRAFEAGQPSLT